MSVKDYRTLFGEHQQGFIKAIHLLKKPIAPQHDPAINADDQQKVSEISAKVAKAQAVNLLFSGHSVADKAKQLNQFSYLNKQPVCLIDCQYLVQHYIGETEKNISRMVADASTENWILFFDEADALFGKRSEVGEAHNKYANQEVSYLLKRISAHSGLSILSVAERVKAELFVSRIDYSISFR